MNNISQNIYNYDNKNITNDRVENKIFCIIQARTNSTRLPNKIFKDICGKSAFQHLIERLRYCKSLSGIIIATTVNKCDDKIIDFCNQNNLPYYRGSEEDVLDRYYQTAKKFDIKHIVRITSDCTLIDPFILNDMIIKFFENKYDNLFMKYTNKIHGAKGGFPDGFNPEIFSFKLLENSVKNTNKRVHREHVTLYMRQTMDNMNEYEIKLDKIYKNINFNTFHLSLDTKDDFILINKIISYFCDKIFTIYDVLNYLNNIL